MINSCNPIILKKNKRLLMLTEISFSACAAQTYYGLLMKLTGIKHKENIKRRTFQWRKLKFEV